MIFTNDVKYLAKLSRFRKIEDLTLEITEDMPINYDIENDYLYKKGFEKGFKKEFGKGFDSEFSKRFENELGIEKKNHLFVVVLCRVPEVVYTNEEIASLVGVSVDYVEKIRKELASKK